MSRRKRPLRERKRGLRKGRRRGLVDRSGGVTAHMVRLGRIVWRRIRRADISVDHATNERVVEATLLSCGVVGKIGEMERTKKLFGSRKEGRNVRSEEKIRREVDSEETRIADVRIESRKNANRAKNGMRIGGYVSEMEGVWRVERVQIERLKIVLKERFFF